MKPDLAADASVGMPLISEREKDVLEAAMSRRELRTIEHLALMMATRDSAWFARLGSNLALAREVAGHLEAIGDAAELFARMAELLTEVKQKAQAGICEGLSVSDILGPVSAGTEAH